MDLLHSYLLNMATLTGIKDYIRERRSWARK